MLITHDMGVVAEMADDVAVMYMGNIVESGSAEQVMASPAHPYTKALLESIPVLGKGKNQKLEPIRGTTPDPYDRPKGCQFAPRCDYATGRVCRSNAIRNDCRRWTHGPLLPSQGVAPWLRIAMY